MLTKRCKQMEANGINLTQKYLVVINFYGFEVFNFFSNCMCNRVAKNLLQDIRGFVVPNVKPLLFIYSCLLYRSC